MNAPFPYALVTCDVFEEELDALTGESKPWVDRRVLEMGLHDRPDILRQEIQSSIAQVESQSGIEAIVLLYGLCGNGLVGVRAGRTRLIMPRAHDCISILLGSPKRHDAVLAERPGTYFYSPGWVRGRRVPGPDREQYLRTQFTQRHPEKPKMVERLVAADREMFAHHNCATYVDLTNNANAAEYCRECAHFMQWDHRELKGDPSLLRDLLSGNWDSERFLILNPGERIGLSFDGSLMRAESGNADT